MPAYKAPVEDALFLLNDVFHIERYANLAGFSEATPDVVAAVLGTAARFCEEVLAPLNQVGDEEGCRRGEDGSVVTPDRLQASLPPLCRGRLDRRRGAAGRMAVSGYRSRSRSSSASSWSRRTSPSPCIRP